MQRLFFLETTAGTLSNCIARVPTIVKIV